MDGSRSSTSTEDPPILTEEENKILDLYDRLNELQLESALLKAKNTLSGKLEMKSCEPASVSELEITTAQDALLKAKAAFHIRCKVAESAIIADPVISAVHAGTDRSFHQQNLISLLKKRDELSLSLIQLSRRELDSLEKLRLLETENMLLARTNTELTSSMLRLVEISNSRINEANESSQSLQELEKIKQELKLSRRKWRTIKAIVSGAIVGSGVDWARDPELLQIVLDED
ncbi:hypothetical protein GcM3_019015 [Golovinomyces cichoracearum]|uniref:Centromere protein H C-terminal domain-containing protein n=1 Tax=Golovinomyces cichoracearum TaxID=62708 RepID=A0A420J845_9PEZI|nr:hypothetical protein GcM3_019015 [Golovinomyces cichoracearum]